MRTWMVPLALAVLGACDVGPWSDPEITVRAVDHAAPLSDADDDELFLLEYECPSDGPRYFASDLRVQLSQDFGRSVFELRKQLVTDADGDGMFGPGDVLQVSEKMFDSLGPDDYGAWKVTVSDTSQIGEPTVGEADWQAR